jgi:NTP pyrophosphatase (non-canonical NTP hydrolase)
MNEFNSLYSTFVRDLAKPGAAILESLTEEKCDLLHSAIGIAGEAGELLDAIKKHVVYNKPLDLQNVMEELGDLEFYLQQMRNRLCIERTMVINRNFIKLHRRYANGYSDAAAQARADKQEAHSDD